VTRKHKTSAPGALSDASEIGAAWTLRYAQCLRPMAQSLFPLRVVLFVAMFAWYLWAIVDLRLVFVDRDVLFLWNARYFTDFLGQPGALMVWTDHLFVQLCYWGWPAAIAIAAVVWLLFVSMIGLCSVLGRARIAGTWLVPGILLVVLYSRYLFPTSAVVGLALATAAGNAWCRMPVSQAWLRFALFVLISLGLYYVLGEAYYCFAAYSAIHEAFTRRRRLSGLLFLLAAAGVKFGLDAALLRLDPASHNFFVLPSMKQRHAPPDWRLVMFCSYFPACALFAASRQPLRVLTNSAWRRLFRRGEDVAPSKPGENRGDVRTGNDRPKPDGKKMPALPLFRWAIGTLLALSLPVATGLGSLDRTHRSLLEIDYCTMHQQWEDVLAKVRTLPMSAYSPSVNHDVNLALYHTGRLPYLAFAYPQPHALLLSVEAVSGRTALLWKPFDLLLELGRVNDAEHVSLEMIETHPCGGALKRLALAKLVKGQSAAASVVLTVLRDDLVWGGWAKDRLQRLAVDPSLGGDEEIQRLRRVMISSDDTPLTTKFVRGGIVIRDEDLLLSLLRQNGENRMAFEYLMMMCLRSNNVQDAAGLFRFLDGLSYPITPPHYEQAALLYLDNHPEQRQNVGSECRFRGRRISEATMTKFRRLQAIARASAGLGEQSRASVASELSDTYFYYFFYLSRKQS
jgi:hypothetical protein